MSATRRGRVGRGDLLVLRSRVCAARVCAARFRRFCSGQRVVLLPQHVVLRLVAKTTRLKEAGREAETKIANNADYPRCLAPVLDQLHITARRAARRDAPAAHRLLHHHARLLVAKLAAWGFYFYHDSGCNQFCASGGHGFRSGICKTQLLPPRFFSNSWSSNSLKFLLLRCK